MAELKEHDAMTCSACGNLERASEGYPCQDCGRFICVICNLRGVTLCQACAAKADAPGAGAPHPGAAGTP